MLYEEILTKAGLTTDQSKTYEVLLKNGVLPASKIALKVGLKRGLGYRVIEQLVTMGLVEKIDKKVALFAPNHPSKLTEMIQKKTGELKATESTLSGTLGPMISDYNMTMGKPNVRFFEGEEGIKKVLEDSLYSKEEILSYADITSIVKYIPKINEWYVEQRKRKGVKKRGILLETPESKKILSNYNKDVTDTRTIKLDTSPFQSIVQIYDGKVSHISLTDEVMIGIIIEDESLYKMQKALFEFTWSNANVISTNIKSTEGDEVAEADGAEK